MHRTIFELHFRAICFRSEATILSKEHEKFYMQSICFTENVTVELCDSTKQENSAEWLLERKERITASKCYELFTYTKNKAPNWCVKLKQYMSPSTNL